MSGFQENRNSPGPMGVNGQPARAPSRPSGASRREALTGGRAGRYCRWGPGRLQGRQTNCPRRLGRLQRQLIGLPQPDQVRPITDRDSPVQMLMNRHRASSQVPTRLGNLKEASVQHDRVVLVDGARVLQTEYPVQVSATAADKGSARLAGRYGKLLVELRDVALSQELVGFR